MKHSNFCLLNSTGIEFIVNLQRTGFLLLSPADHCGGSCYRSFFFFKVYKVNSWLSYMLLKQPSICEGRGWQRQWMACEVQHFKRCLTHTRASGSIDERNHLNNAEVQKQSVDSSLWTLTCWHRCDACVRQMRLRRVSSLVASCN